MNIKALTDILKNLKISTLKQKYANVKEVYKSGRKGKFRVLIISLSAVFILDYCMFSSHVGSNILNIFPAIPALEGKKVINIYLPSENSEKIITEKRKIDADIAHENLAAKLFKQVVSGSFYENTAANVPAKLIIKKVWIHDTGSGRDCYIDLMPVLLGKNSIVIKGSEKMIRESIEKTIKENIPDINRVLILEKGVPFKPLWEI